MTKRSLGRTRNANIREINKNILRMHTRPEQCDSEWMNFNPNKDISHESTQNALLRRISCVSPVVESSKIERTAPQTYTSSDMSSASSWTDDGYEQEATEKVQELFDAIDCSLYEDQELPDELKELHIECEYWTIHHPHLRINGMKLATNETGLFESSLITPIITTTDTHKQQVDEDLRPGSYFPSDTELCLMVKGISLKPEIVDVSNDDWDESTNVYGVRDEIIDQEGEYEELIAIDRSEEDMGSNKLTDDIGSSDHRKLLIMNCLMKNMWKEIVSRLRPLLATYIAFALKGYQQSDDKCDEIRVGYLTNELPMIRCPTNRMLTEGATDLQSLLTISSKTLLDRNTDKFRSGAQTSAPALVTGTRLLSPSPPKIVSRSTRGRLAPLGRSAKISPISNTSSQEGFKTSSFPMTPLSPHSWGRHFPLPPIDSGSQVLSTLPLSLLQKERFNNPPLRMLSAVSSRRGHIRDYNKSRLNTHNYPSSTKLADIRSNRLYSAQLDCMRSYPVSYAAFGGSSKSTSNLNVENKTTSGFPRRRIDTAYRRIREPSYDLQEVQSTDRFSAGYFHRSLEKRSNR